MSTALEVFGVIAAGLAVTGVWLNNRRRIGCFALWMASNAISATLHGVAAYNGICPWSLMARDVLFFALAIDGWRRWRQIINRKS